MSYFRRLACFLASLDLIVLALGYAYFMATDLVPLWFWGVIAALYLMRWWGTGRFILLTPISVPTGIILLLIPVTLWASVDWSLSLPKVYGLGLSVAICLSLVNHLQRGSDVGRMTFALIFLALGFAALGLVGVSWGTGKVISLPFLYQRLPHLLNQIPRSLSGGVSPNGIGGVLVFFVPLLLSLIAYPPVVEIDNYWRRHSYFQISHVYLRIIAVGFLLIVLFVLLLTQSRGAVMGMSAGVLFWLIWRDRRWLIMVGALILFLFVVILSGRLSDLSELFLQMDTVVGNVSQSVAGRFELWQRGMYIVQDFSFTGIGIGTFDKVVNILYPLFLLGPDSKPTHVHNQLLQVAVDMGLPVLVAYVALLSSFTFSALRAYQVIYDRSVRAVIVGLVYGVWAQQVFGLTDAFLLGTKPAVVMWIYIGIMTSIFMQRRHLAIEPSRKTAQATSFHNEMLLVSPSISARMIGLLWPMLYWLLFSLLGISFIGDHFFVGMAIILSGGLVVGYLCVQAFVARE